MGWQRFLDMVQSELNALKGVDKVAEQNTPSSWAKDAWEWAKKEGITDGTRPKDTPTREELVTMLHRYHKKVAQK
jgi:N-acetylmuramoyl-L-alanine amidase